MKRLSLAVLTLLACTGAQAASKTVEMNLVTSQGVGQSIGEVTITQTEKGLEFTPDLKALPPGEHGFHIHAKAVVSLPLKTAKRLPPSPQAGILTRIKPVNMPGRTVKGTWAICPCWW